MIPNILLSIFTCILTLVIFGMEYLWKNSNYTKYFIAISLSLIIILGLLSIVTTVNDNRSQNKLEKEIQLLRNENATLEQQKYMLAMMERMNHYLMSDHTILSKKYPDGYFLFATNQYTIVPSSKSVKDKFELDWSNSSIITNTTKIIHLHFKQFIYKPTNIQVDNLNIVLERKIGAVAAGLFFDNICLQVELLDKSEDNFIYVIGFKDRNSIPTFPKENEVVMEYCKSTHYPLILGGIDTNDQRYIVIEDFMMISGWEVE